MISETRDWAMPRRLAACACVRPSLSIHWRSASANSDLSRSTAASWGGNPRSRKMLPLDSLTFAMTCFLCQCLSLTVTPLGQIDIHLGGLLHLLLERAQDVDCIGKLRHIDYPEGAGHVAH